MKIEILMLFFHAYSAHDVFTSANSEIPVCLEMCYVLFPLPICISSGAGFAFSHVQHDLIFPPKFFVLYSS